MTNGQEANQARIEYLEEEIDELKNKIEELEDETRRKLKNIKADLREIKKQTETQGWRWSQIKGFLKWLLGILTGIISYIASQQAIKWLLR